MIALPDAALLIFAKAPVPGTVKTRLLAILDEEETAELHIRLVRHTLTTATTAALASIELWCAPDTRHPFFQECQSRFALSLHTQQGNDLGERMAFALASALRRHPTAVLIGTDCPVLSTEDLRQACVALRQGFEAIIGPAEDGGYVLIGLRRPHPSLFAGIDWGSENVLPQTRARLAAEGLRWHELPPRWDIDRPADLARLKQTMPELFIQ